MELSGKTILITGGRRIGGRLAVLLAARGARIALSYFQSRRQMENVAHEVRQAGSEAFILQADLRNSQDVDTLVTETLQRFSSIDCLVNLTSIYQPQPLNDLQPADVEDSLASNLKAPLLTSLAVAKAMLQQPVKDGLQGKIIHFTDWAVVRPYQDFLPYLVAKGGIATLTKTLAVELAPTIPVNAIAPGTVDPPPHLNSTDLEHIRQSTLLERTGSADDVNKLVIYLLEGTDFVTGEIFRVDGGRFLGRG